MLVHDFIGHVGGSHFHLQLVIAASVAVVRITRGSKLL
jgi:hypothetical protein